MRTKTILAAGCTVAMLFVSAQSQAVPAFARSNNLSCAACHSAFPSLNSDGRLFKSRGYRTEDRKAAKSSDFTTDVSQFPISAGIISRPYTKDSEGNSEIRAIHELELFLGGVLYQNLSGFMEIESEGEDGFGNVLGVASFNYDFNDAAHLQIAYGPTFFADPYDTLSDHRKLTAAHYGMFNSEFGGSDNDGVLRHSRQQISLFGRLAGDRIFYNAGVGGLTEDNVGNESTVVFGRVAFEPTPSVMVGGFALDGDCKAKTESDFADCGSTTDRNFSRVGLDTQIDVGPLRFTGVYLSAKDDLADSTLDETNDFSYVQAVYYGEMGGKAIVPLVRYENSQANDGNDETQRLTGGITYYFQDNFKGSIEYGKDTSVPDGEDKVSNVTLQFMVAF